jgi:hypothetical protein
MGFAKSAGSHDSQVAQVVRRARMSLFLELSARCLLNDRLSNVPRSVSENCTFQAFLRRKLLILRS